MHSETAKELRLLQSKAKKLQPKHFVWMAQAIAEEYRKRIIKLELELIRLRTGESDGIPPSEVGSPDPMTRGQLVNETWNQLHTSMAILDFARTASRVIALMDAEVFAKAFWASRK